MDKFLPADLSDMDLGDDLAPRQFVVRYGSKVYVAVEASEAAAVAYNNALMRAMKMSGEGKITGVDGFAGVEPVLVSSCLYEAGLDGRLVLTVTGDPDPSRLVLLSMVNRWPARVVKPIFDRLKLISGLAEPETEEALVRQLADVQDKLAKVREAKVTAATTSTAGGQRGNA